MSLDRALEPIATPCDMTSRVPMRICILGNAQSQHIIRWVEFFRSRRHKVFVISARPNRIPGAYVYTPRLPWDRLVRRRETFDEDRSPHLSVYLTYAVLAFRIRSLLRRISPDIVMPMTLENNGALMLISGFRPAALWHLGPKALSIKSESSLVVRFLVKQMLASATLLYTADRAGAERICELGGDSRKIRVFKYGVDTQVFTPMARSNRLRSEWDATDKTVITCARPLVEEYCVDTFLDALPRVLADHNQVKCVVIGGGPLRAKYEARVAGQGLSDRVIFTGHVPYDELPVYLASTDIYVDPVAWKIPRGRSWWGRRMQCSAAGTGFTVTLAAALSCGCAPAVIDRPAMRELLPDDFSTSLWRSSDSADLAETLSRLLAQPELLASMRDWARQVAVTEFDWQQNCLQVEREYMQLLTAAPQRTAAIPATAGSVALTAKPETSSA